MKRPLVLGETKNGLYQLFPSSLHFKKDAIFFSSSGSNTRNSDFHLWHVKLGHLSISSMNKLVFFDFKYDSNFICDVCHLTRQTKLPFPLSHIKTKSLFELIHIDKWGPYKNSTNNGHKYFLTIVDDFSRTTWTYFLSTKANAFPMLKQFLSMVQRQFNCQVKTIRSDNALELGKGSAASEFLLSQGILHQTSCTSTPQQNRIVERKHRHLLETSRALLFQSNLPISY